MSILSELLEKMLNRDIVVVMDDGMAFKGILKRYDDEGLLLIDVMETKASDGRWREALITVPSSSEEGSIMGGIMLGDTGSSMLKLTSVYISLAHVSRVWIWSPEKPTGY